MKEENNEEIDLHIKEMMEGVEQEKGDRKQARHVAFVKKFNHSAEEGAKMLHQMTRQTERCSNVLQDASRKCIRWSLTLCQVSRVVQALTGRRRGAGSISTLGGPGAKSKKKLFRLAR